MFAGRGKFASPLRRDRRNDSGSMPIALLITLVGVTLSGSLTTLVVGQLTDSRRSADRTAAVAVAQAGLDSMLAKIRSAVTLQSGDIGKLPCTTLAGRLTALNGTSPGAPSYSVSIGYFLVDPGAFVDSLTPLGDLTKLTNAVTSVPNLLAGVGQVVTDTTTLGTALSKAITCVDGVLSQVPIYGLLRSTGTVGSVSRTLYATYTFANVDATIPGGAISIAPQNVASSPTVCLGSSDPTPTENDPVTAVPCPATALQLTVQNKLIYPKNLSLALTDTRTTTTDKNSSGPRYPYGLCITAANQAAGSAVLFQQCSATSSPDQEWDYDVNQQTYYGARATVTNGLTTVVRSGFCLGMKTPSAAAGGEIVMSKAADCGKAGVFGHSMVPDATVGSGGAGPASGQFVNKGEVGRCLDLTNQDPSGAWATKNNQPLGLISYPCKQTLSGSVFWNHKWAGPLTTALLKAGVTSATGTLYSTDTKGQDWCMQSPGAAGGYVWVAKCASTDASLRWTVNSASPSITDAYQVTDVSGNCLEAAQKRGPAYIFSTKYNIIISYIITAPCNGSDQQKWNSPPSPALGPLRGIQER